MDHRSHIPNSSLDGPRVWSEFEASAELSKRLEAAILDDSPIRLGMLSDDERALCTEIDSELFFPSQGEPTLPAKEVCAHCDLRSTCLVASVVGSSSPESDGVWGGMSATERTRIVRRGQGLIEAYVTKFGISSSIRRYGERSSVDDEVA